MKARQSSLTSMWSITSQDKPNQSIIRCLLCVRQCMEKVLYSAKVKSETYRVCFWRGPLSMH